MIKKWQAIYPSTKIDQPSIDAYGWRLAEDIPAYTNTAGHLAPTPEASAYLRDLRAVIDERPTLKLATEDTVLEIEDFAIAKIPGSTEQKLGFFVLLPKE